MTIEFLNDSANDPSTKAPDGVQEETFKPKGALAFFCGMILLYAALWFSLYSSVLKRN